MVLKFQYSSIILQPLNTYHLISLYFSDNSSKMTCFDRHQGVPTYVIVTVLRTIHTIYIKQRT